MRVFIYLRQTSKDPDSMVGEIGGCGEEGVSNTVESIEHSDG